MFNNIFFVISRIGPQSSRTPRETCWRWRIWAFQNDEQRRATEGAQIQEHQRQGCEKVYAIVFELRVRLFYLKLCILSKKYKVLYIIKLETRFDVDIIYIVETGARNGSYIKKIKQDEKMKTKDGVISFEVSFQKIIKE